MKDIMKITFVAVLIGLSVSTLQAIPIKEYKPIWEVGQNWTIEITGKTQQKKLSMKRSSAFIAKRMVIKCNFIVETKTVVGGEPCWCIRIDFLQKKKDGYQSVPVYKLYYRISDFTMKRVERLGGNGALVEAGYTYSGGDAIISEWTRPLPMAFPFFYAKTNSLAPRVNKIVGGTGIYNSYSAHQATKLVKQEIRGENKDILFITLEGRGELGNEGLSDTQIWEKGMPWWTEATETENGVFQSKARLVSINGKRLENLPEWDLKSTSISPSATKK